MSAYRDFMLTASKIGELSLTLGLHADRAERENMAPEVAKDLHDAIAYLKAARQLVHRAANATPQTAPISLPIAAE